MFCWQHCLPFLTILNNLVYPKSICNGRCCHCWYCWQHWTMLTRKHCSVTFSRTFDRLFIFYWVQVVSETDAHEWPSLMICNISFHFERLFGVSTGTKLKGGMRGWLTPPPNSRFRRAQGKFAGQKCGIWHAKMKIQYLNITLWQTDSVSGLSLSVFELFFFCLPTMSVCQMIDLNEKGPGDERSCV